MKASKCCQWRRGAEGHRGELTPLIHYAQPDAGRRAAASRRSACRRCVVLNEKPLDVLGDDVTQDQAFAHANDVLKNAVDGISDIIHMHGLVNVEFEDVKTVMSEPGKAMMGTAQAGGGPDRAKKAAEAAVASPLLEGIDLSGARGVLVLIAANRNNFKLNESKATPAYPEPCTGQWAPGPRRPSGWPWPAGLQQPELPQRLAQRALACSGQGGGAVEQRHERD